MLGRFLRRRFETLNRDTAAAIEQVLINQGRQLSLALRNERFPRLSDYEWKVFSQWGEDGMLDFLIQSIEIENDTFIEFGVENFSESNCRYLMQSGDWRGFIIDGSERNIADARSRHWYWKHDINAKASFITAENIEGILAESGFDRDLGVLSIDIDGMDYFVLEAISGFAPRILIAEFNPIFGQTLQATVPYDPNFQRTAKDPSNLYWGASIAALQSLARKKGMTLVGTGRMGANAFFVRDDLLTPHLTEMAAAPYNCSFRFSESRDPQGNLTFLRGDERAAAIRGMPILNIETGTIEAF